MHDRPPASDAERKRAIRRERDRIRQHDKRVRDGMGIVAFPGRASADFIEAMKARAMFFGASKQEAERDADDPKKIAELAFDVLDDWVPTWYSKK
jgi:hypothetical protein